MMSRRLLLFASLWMALLATFANAATPTISAAAYRARLEAARNSIDQQQRHPPVNATKVLGGLKNDVVVKRSDGATQLVHGDEWANRLSTPRDGSDPAKLTGHQARELRGALDTQLKAFDAWNTPKGGAFYQPANAQKIVAQLEESGQIRTKPLWWQSRIASIKNSLWKSWAAFMKWLGNLLPKGTTSNRAPDMAWLLWLFWALVIAIIGAIFYWLVRAFGGRFGTISWFGLGRRKKPGANFEGEDAALLLLPPDELRQRAENFAAQGNFREALRHRFIALLLHLDHRDVWRYDIRRTNWEHISALRREEVRRPLVAPLSDLTQRFDRVRYGGADCTSAEWSHFQRDVQGLENQIGHSQPHHPKVAEVAR